MHDRIRELVEREIPALTELRRDLHSHPELGLQEHRTSGVVARELAAVGIDHQTGLAGGTGVLAHIRGASPTAIALRADMDALPIEEITGVPWASRVSGVMHACGHDGHTTILIGAARVLAQIARERPLARGVTLVFQPAEECLDGAARMIADGCLKGRLGPPVDEIYGLHGWPFLPVGTIGVRNGALLAAGDFFTVTLRGKTAHAGWPHLSADVIVAMSAIISSLQSIVSRNSDPNEPVVVSVCKIRAGEALNVLPPTATFEGTIRTLGGRSREHTLDRFRTIVEQIAGAHGCEASINMLYGCPATINEPVATDSVRSAVRATSSATLAEVGEPCMGGEDFAWYGDHARASFFLLGLRGKDASTMPSLHDGAFDFNDDALALGIETLCRVALGET